MNNDFIQKIKRELDQTVYYKEKELKFIKNHSIKYKLTSLIFMVEIMNRGDFLTNKLESLLVKLFPNFVIYKDMSIGPFQIKPSFKDKMGYNSYSVDKLLEFKFSLDLINEFIKKYENTYSDYELIKLYHSGDIKDNSASSQIYIELYKWVMQNYE